MAEVPQARVLIVEGDRMARSAAVAILEPIASVQACESAEAAELLIGEARPDIVLTEANLPGESGLTLIRKLRQLAPETGVIMMMAHASMEVAVEAMRAGAHDVIAKPLNFEALRWVVDREIEGQRSAIEARALRESSMERVRNLESWGESPEMQDVLRTALEVAPTQANVLIAGETGTGKEVLARFIHRQSRRAKAGFVAVNCGAIPENLVESEFFGHEAGSFTGATGRRIGRFEQANEGTLFLDEVGELSLAMQVKLLRVLQERQVERVGGAETVALDGRVIAATNRDLRKMIAQGLFREDLYYRLNVISLTMPPLRVRRSDVLALWSTFVARFAERESREFSESGAEVVRALRAYAWPGNVRELENAAERAVILARGGPIHVAHLPESVRSRLADPEVEEVRIPGSSLAEIERLAILRTLAMTHGNRTRAAEILGISPRKIQYRLLEWRPAEAASPTPAGVVVVK